jgi:hypothetical protein
MSGNFHVHLLADARPDQIPDSAPSEIVEDLIHDEFGLAPLVFDGLALIISSWDLAQSGLDTGATPSAAEIADPLSGFPEENPRAVRKLLIP